MSHQLHVNSGRGAACCFSFPFFLLHSSQFDEFEPLYAIVNNSGIGPQQYTPLGVYRSGVISLLIKLACLGSCKDLHPWVRHVVTPLTCGCASHVWLCLSRAWLCLSRVITRGQACDYNSHVWLHVLGRTSPNSSPIVSHCPLIHYMFPFWIRVPCACFPRAARTPLLLSPIVFLFITCFPFGYEFPCACFPCAAYYKYKSGNCGINLLSPQLPAHSLYYPHLLIASSAAALTYHIHSCQHILFITLSYLQLYQLRHNLLSTAAGALLPCPLSGGHW